MSIMTRGDRLILFLGNRVKLANDITYKRFIRLLIVGSLGYAAEIAS